MEEWSGKLEEGCMAMTIGLSSQIKIVTCLEYIGAGTSKLIDYHNLWRTDTEFIYVNCFSKLPGKTRNIIDAQFLMPIKPEEDEGLIETEALVALQNKLRELARL